MLMPNSSSASEMTYIVSSGALNSTHYPLPMPNSDVRILRRTVSVNVKIAFRATVDVKKI